MCRRTKIRTLILNRVNFVDGENKSLSTCWIWKGSNSGTGRGGGYPRIKLDGGTMAVHRVMFIVEHGPIPPGKQLDHLCRNRMCVNPDHLEMVTHKQNQKRRDAARKEKPAKFSPGGQVSKERDNDKYIKAEIAALNKAQLTTFILSPVPPMVFDVEAFKSK